MLKGTDLEEGNVGWVGAKVGNGEGDKVVGLNCKRLQTGM